MNVQTMKQIISEGCNDVLFMYNSMSSGITSEIYASVPFFQVWHGGSTKVYFDIDTLMTDRFFSGKSISDLISEVEFKFA